MSGADRDSACLLQIHPLDNIAVASRPLLAGQQVSLADITMIVPSDVRLGGKIALRTIAEGEKVIKYGEPIGSATIAIEVGDYVHTHNLHSDYLPTPENRNHENQ